MVLHRSRFRHLVPAAALLLAGCTNLPDLGDAAPVGLEDADYPVLIPLDGTFQSDPPPREAGAQAAAALAARRAALLRRAADLQGPVVDAETEERMRRGVAD
mgnify:CR=1 FL=1